MIITTDLAEGQNLARRRHPHVFSTARGPSPSKGTVRAHRLRQLASHQGDKINSSIRNGRALSNGQPVRNTVIVNAPQPSVLSENLPHRLVGGIGK